MIRLVRGWVVARLHLRDHYLVWKFWSEESCRNQLGRPHIDKA